MSDPSRISVTIRPCSCASINASFAHHRDFPETCGEGHTSRAAALQLANQLTLALDHASTDWHQSQIRAAIEDANAFAAACGEGAKCPSYLLTRKTDRLRSLLVGLDGSADSAAAVRLGIQWARQTDALLVGLAIVDQPTIAAEEPVLLGGVPYADPIFYRERMADARRQATGFLEQFSVQCAEACVASKVLEDVGMPADEIALEAQRYDLVLLGRNTRFHFEVQERHDDTLMKVVKTGPRPVVVVPEAAESGDGVIIAYDGSDAAARALFAFEHSGLGRDCPVHIVSVHEEQKVAARHAERANDFLRHHDIRAQVHPVASHADPAGIILKHIHDLGPGLLVLGPYGHSAMREFFLGSATRTLLRESPIPLFVFH